MVGIEIILLVGLFFTLSPSGPPGVNEPHYLCKAKHFWDPDFCPGDVFLESADAHLLFYVTLGWLTKFFSLTTAAWIGRFICWTAIAIGWRMLSYVIIPRAFWSLLTAGLTIVLLRHAHFAGEWLIGGVEAKGIAYGLLFAGLSFLIRRKWAVCWILFGAASAFHVLVGGWAVVAGAIALIIQKCGRLPFIGRKRASDESSMSASGGWKSQIIGLSIGFLLSLAGLVPALMLTSGQDANVVNRANEIYTFERIAHHLVFSHICVTTPARLDFFLAAVLVWFTGVFLFPGRERGRLNSFILGTLILATIAVVLDYRLVQQDAAGEESREWAARILRYYWFRLSDVFIPVGVAFLFADLAYQLFRRYYDLAAVLLVLLVALVLAEVARVQFLQQYDRRPQADKLTLTSFPGLRDFNQKIYRDWVDACCWIRQTTPTDARFLTPRSQSTFKWYAQRSEVVAWKDVPQDAPGIVAWKDRFEHVFKFDNFHNGLATLNAEQRLVDLGKKYSAQFVVIERRHLRNRKQTLNFWIEFSRINKLGWTDLTEPLDKPLYLKQIYPNRNCDPEVIRNSSYLVYRLEIPDAYREKLRKLQKIISPPRPLPDGNSSRGNSAARD